MKDANSSGAANAIFGIRSIGKPCEETGIITGIIYESSDVGKEHANLSSSLSSEPGMDPEHSFWQLGEGLFSLGQKKGGRVHAFIVDDGISLTLIDTLYD